MEKQLVAVLGTGRMGGAMVGTLRRAGFGVTAYNRTPQRAEEVARNTGASVARTPAEAVAEAQIAISSLAEDSAVREVYLGPEGAAGTLQEGSVVLEMSTIDPRTVREIEPAVTAGGAALLDAPVSGSVSLVEQGQLTIMVGGDDSALDQARPVLEVLAATIFHVGGLGSGATIKLAVNAIVHSNAVALSEALVLAERSGVDRKAAYEVFAGSVAASPFVHYKRRAFEHPEDKDVAFALDLVVKDLDLILSLAESVHAPMSQGKVNRQLMAAAAQAGYGNQDMSSVADYIRGQTTAAD